MLIEYVAVGALFLALLIAVVFGFRSRRRGGVAGDPSTILPMDGGGTGSSFDSSSPGGFHDGGGFQSHGSFDGGGGGSDGGGGHGN